MNKKRIIPTINFHLIKACNFKCKFCYAAFKDFKGKGLNKEDQLSLIEKLAQSRKFKKINFAGGEPTLIPHLKELINFAKDKGFETSLVTNLSRIDISWLQELKKLDILAISIDSFSDETNLQIGRNEKGKLVDFQKIKEIAQYCHENNIYLKINTVVCSFNKNEILTSYINLLKPKRWKILQVTKIQEQNDEQFEEVKVSKEEFEKFCIQNKNELLPDIKLISEDNEIIKGSYLMINPLGRFFDNSLGKYDYSQPILEVGVENALSEISTDYKKFEARNGNYNINTTNDAHSQNYSRLSTAV